MSFAASLADVEDYAPGTAFSFVSDWPVSYVLTTKWVTFEVRRDANGPVLFRTTSDEAHISLSGVRITVYIPWDAANNVTGGELFDNVIQSAELLEWKMDVGDDGDTDTAEYRVQGHIRPLPSHGRFTTPYD
jgi:hypothetical protein